MNIYISLFLLFQFGRLQTSAQPGEEGRKRAGCIPFRLIKATKGRECENIEVCMINSRNKPGKLVFPKGGIEPTDEDEERAARRETQEEAGLTGNIIERLTEGTPSEPAWFLLEVTEEETSWVEEASRQRYWLSLSHILKDREVFSKPINRLMKIVKSYFNC